MRTYVRGYVLRAEGEDPPADGPIRFVAANEGMQADGIDLHMDTADLSRYRANPIVGYGHDYWGRESLPIGRSDSVEVDGSRLLADIAFDREDAFAAEVDRKYRGGYMNAVSIGFRYEGLDEETGVPDSWELFEISAVPIPMDPAALAADGRARALADAYAGLRAGKVLSAADEQLVADALAALLAVGGDDDEPPRPAPRLTAARQRLRLAGGGS